MLYQEAFQTAVTPARRAEWSRLIANGLAELNKADPSRVAAELAMHYEAGRDFHRAAQWFLQAARNAAQVYANHEAADLCKRAITNADRLETGLRNAVVLDAAMLRAELHLNVSAFENAVADFGLAEKAASDAGLVEAQVDAICGAALALFNLKRTSETRALGFKALELATCFRERDRRRVLPHGARDGAHVRGRPRCGGTLEHLCAARAPKRRSHAGSAARD